MRGGVTAGVFSGEGAQKQAYAEESGVVYEGAFVSRSFLLGWQGIVDNVRTVFMRLKQSVHVPQLVGV